MEQPIYQQLIQVAASLLTGCGLGIVYDVLRGVRRAARRGVLTVVLDAVYWILAGLTLFYLGMDWGAGELRLFMLAMALAGAALYFATISKMVLEIMRQITIGFKRILIISVKPASFFRKGLKKMKKVSKTPFKKVKNDLQ